MGRKHADGRIRRRRREGDHVYWIQMPSKLDHDVARVRVIQVGVLRNSYISPSLAIECGSFRMVRTLLRAIRMDWPSMDG